MNKLIICTTAILRGKLHEVSLGYFYKKYYNILKQYKVYHIINLDEPEKLKLNFTKDETLNILDKIIPEFVDKIIINEKEIGFTKAYICIMKKIEELKLVDDKTIIWWLEDDWKCIRNYNFFKLCNIFLSIKNSSLTITDKTPLGSLRGGPIMNNLYFNNIFNIHKLINPNKDPEFQIRKFTGGLERSGVKRDIMFENSNIINIFCLFLTDYTNINISKFCEYYYKRKLTTSFDENIILKFHLITMKNENSEELKYILLGNEDNLSIKSFFELKISFYDLYFKNKNLNEKETMNIMNFQKKFNDNSLCYFVIVPDILVDIGRKFAKKNKLKKWDNSGIISYQ